LSSKDSERRSISLLPSYIFFFSARSVGPRWCLFDCYSCSAFALVRCSRSTQTLTVHFSPSWAPAAPIRFFHSQGFSLRNLLWLSTLPFFRTKRCLQPPFCSLGGAWLIEQPFPSLNFGLYICASSIRFYTSTPRNLPFHVF